jgi:hypothetical protein
MWPESASSWISDLGFKAIEEEMSWVLAMHVPLNGVLVSVAAKRSNDLVSVGTMSQYGMKNPG